MSRLKRKWLKELDSALPLPEGMEASTRVKSNRRPWIYALSAVSSFACVFIVCLVLILRGGTTPPVPTPTPTPTPTPSFVVGAVSVEINPSATFLTDAQGKVTRVVATNADADIILADDERYNSLLGIPLEDAVTAFVDYSARCGFLDLSGPDAVRISATADIEESWLGKATSSLETYFTEQRIQAVVVSEMLDIDNFCLRNGIENIKDKDQLATWGKNVSKEFMNGFADGMSADALAQKYRDEVVNQMMKPSLTNYIDAYIKDIVWLYQTNLSINIYALDDYWGLTEHGPSFLAPNKEEAKKLQKEMEKALLTFETDYGKKIGSTEELNAAFALIPDLLAKFLTAWDADISEALNLMEESGLSVGEKLRTLSEGLPTDAETFRSMTKAAQRMCFERLEEENKEKYEGERPEVDRDKLHEDIRGEYGSFEDFFEKKGKKF